MKEYVISKNEEGRRLDKFASHILCNAPRSFTYRMLRKKNIVLNDSKASGGEILSEGDVVKFYLSDETFSSFAEKISADPSWAEKMPPIVYEDENILIVNKPAGMLSQRSAKSDISLNEICLSYVIKQSSDKGSSDGFTPSICNRLDRNTSGLVIFAKTYPAARTVTANIRNRLIKKYYKCIVSGCINEDMYLSGKLIKDSKTNTVTVSSGKEGADIITIVHPIDVKNDISLVQIELVTGKTHQIRAHMASVGHPLIGDRKYGDAAVNDKFEKHCGIKSQMLTCYKLIFPPDPELDKLAGKSIEIDLPDEFNKVI